MIDLCSPPLIETKFNIKHACLVVFSAASFFFYEFILLNMFNAIDPDLQFAFGFNATNLGYLSAAALFSNVFGASASFYAHASSKCDEYGFYRRYYRVTCDGLDF